MKDIVSPRLLAISLRSTSETAYREERDALARDWWPFLQVALPGVLPLLLPNEASYAARLCALPDVIGLLLTGGNDVGTCPERDRAEEAAFRAIRDRDLPVLGVCRGLQFLVHLHGGGLQPSDTSIHRARRHQIDPLESWIGPVRDVNSYHAIEATLAPDGPLIVSATGPDGSLEATRHQGSRIYAIQWHPERESDPHHADLAAFRRIFLPGGDS